MMELVHESQRAIAQLAALGIGQLVDALAR